MSVSSKMVPQTCLLCRQSGYERLKQFVDGVTVGRCLTCGFVYTPLRHPRPEDLLVGNEIEDLRVLSRPIINGSKRHYRSRNFAEYLTLIEQHAPGRRLLDIGCAQGFFLAAARERGYEVVGVEPSRPIVRFAREAFGLEVLEGKLSDVDLGERRWDVVTFTDSLEYLPDPLKDLSKIALHLAPRGIVFLKVPNGDYFVLRHRIEARVGHGLGGDEAFGPSRRVAHYTGSTLRRLVEMGGFKCIDWGVCRPIHSPRWVRWTGLALEMEPPSVADRSARLVRQILHALGRAERMLRRSRTLFAQGLYVIATRRG